VTTNDSATATTSVNAPPAPPPSGGGSSGGGGGGRFDWLAAVLLGGLLLRRLARHRAAARDASGARSMAVRRSRSGGLRRVVRVQGVPAFERQPPGATYSTNHGAENQHAAA
jgi:hypothetical protein